MRILLPVPRNGLPAGTVSLCAATAVSIGASVRVLFVVDSEGIERTGAGAHPGSIHLSGEAARSMGEREEGAGERLVEKTVESLVAIGIEASGEVREGDPHDEISRDASECDLLVSSILSHYAFRDRDRPGALLLHLMKDRVIPALLAGSVGADVRTVAVGCDGGEHSLRAVAALSRLGLWRGERILLASSHREKEECARRVSEARRILLQAGYPKLEEHFLTPPKGESFPDLCGREGAQAALLGGWGEHRWDDLLGLSLTGIMVRDGRFHLFLHM